MKKHVKMIVVLFLLCAICFSFPKESKADATVVGSVPIQLGVPVPVTLGSDQVMQFTFTPASGMRVNIWQDYDPSALVHIAPAYLESNQEHWSSGNSKGVKVSLNAGEAYTFEVLIPEHLPGGSFNVYLDLVGMEHTPQVRPELESIEVTSGFSMSFVYGQDGYGEMRPEGYAFYPFSPLWWEGLTFDLVDSTGGRKTVRWEDLEWPVDINGRSNFARYEGEPITFCLEGKNASGPEIVLTEPEVLTGVLSYKGIEGRFAVEVLPGGTSGEQAGDSPLAGVNPEELQPWGTVEVEVQSENFTELDGSALEQISGMDNSLEIQLSEAVVLFNTEAVHTISRVSEGETVALEFAYRDVGDLTEQQQQAIAEMNFHRILSLETMSREEIHDFEGGIATVKIFFDGEDGKTYQVYYVSEDGNLEEMETRYADGVLEFDTPHFSDFVVVEKETDETDSVIDGSVNEEEKTDLDNVTDVVDKEMKEPDSKLPWGVIAGVVIVALAVLGIVYFKKKR